MTLNDDAVLAMQRGPAAGHAALGPGIVQYKQAYEALRTSTDVVQAMQAATALILGAEAVRDAAEGIVTDARKALAGVMVDTGAPAVRIPGFVASLTEPKPALKVLDPQALPPELTTQPPPKPDMRKVQAAWDAGERPTGVAMMNGSAPFVTIRSRKEV